MIFSNQKTHFAHYEWHRVQRVQDIMLVAVQMVQGRCRGDAGWLHHLNRHERYIRCREV